MKRKDRAHGNGEARTKVAPNTTRARTWPRSPLRRDCPLGLQSTSDPDNDP